jgi:hypothetical protein
VIGDPADAPVVGPDEGARRAQRVPARDERPRQPLEHGIRHLQRPSPRPRAEDGVQRLQVRDAGEDASHGRVRLPVPRAAGGDGERAADPAVVHHGRQQAPRPRRQRPHLAHHLGIPPRADAEGGGVGVLVERLREREVDAVAAAQPHALAVRGRRLRRQPALAPVVLRHRDEQRQQQADGQQGEPECHGDMQRRAPGGVRRVPFRGRVRGDRRLRVLPGHTGFRRRRRRIGRIHGPGIGRTAAARFDGGRRGRRGHGARVGGLGCAELLGQGAGVRVRLAFHHARQPRLELLVVAQGAVALSPGGLHAHDAPVPLLPHGVDLHRALAQAQRPLPVSRRLGLLARALQQVQGGVAQLRPAPVRPVAKVLRPRPGVESLQERAAIEGERVVHPFRVQPPAQQVHGVARQLAAPAHGVLFRRQQPRRQHAHQPPQRLGERVARARFPALAPQQRRQPSARVHGQPLHAQVDEQRQVLSAHARQRGLSLAKGGVSEGL